MLLANYALCMNFRRRLSRFCAQKEILRYNGVGNNMFAILPLEMPILQILSLQKESLLGGK